MTLREWLNNSFVYLAFNEKENNAIVSTQCDNGLLNTTITNDRVFLLSVEEVEYYFPYEEDRIAYATVPCLIFPRGTVGYSEYGSNPSPSVYSWWTRTCSSYKAPREVGSDGEIGPGGFPSAALCVRPVIWIDLNKLDGS